MTGKNGIMQGVNRSEDRQPDIPVGNLEPATLAEMLVDDFKVAWDAMATGSPDPRVGGNFMFARQAFGYLELASRTASNDGTAFWLDRFASYLADRDRRYFAELPGAVPLPRADDFVLPAASGRPPERQLLAALFDMSRHGLAHIYQQTPVDLADGKQWQITFTGVYPGALWEDAGSTARRDLHLSYRVGPREGRVYLIVSPDVLLADLEFAARAAGLLSQYNVPEYLARPRRPLGHRRRLAAKPEPVYAFTRDALTASLDAAGMPRRGWPVDVSDGAVPSASAPA
jgi:hypothetical protein